MSINRVQDKSGIPGKNSRRNETSPGVSSHSVANIHLRHRYIGFMLGLVVIGFRGKNDIITIIHFHAVSIFVRIIFLRFDHAG